MMVFLTKEIDFEENLLSNTLIEYKSSIPLSRLYKNSFLRFYVGTSISLMIIMLFVIINPFIPIGNGIMVCLIFLVISYLVVLFRSLVVEESILIIQDFGIQLRILYLTGVEQKLFLSNDKVEGFFIHEYVIGSQVKFSLAFLVKGEQRLRLVFKHLYPGFDSLRRVYSACQSLNVN